VRENYKLDLSRRRLDVVDCKPKANEARWNGKYRMSMQFLKFTFKKVFLLLF
jgi:hypothetical protein